MPTYRPKTLFARPGAPPPEIPVKRHGKPPGRQRRDTTPEIVKPSGVVITKQTLGKNNDFEDCDPNDPDNPEDADEVDQSQPAHQSRAIVPVDLGSREVEVFWRGDKLGPAERTILKKELSRLRSLPAEERAAAFLRGTQDALQKLPILLRIMPAEDLVKNAMLISKLWETGAKAFGIQQGDGSGQQTIVNVGILGTSVQVPESMSKSVTIVEAEDEDRRA